MSTTLPASNPNTLAGNGTCQASDILDEIPIAQSGEYQGLSLVPAGDVMSGAEEPDPFMLLAQTAAAAAVEGDTRIRIVPITYLFGVAFKGFSASRRERHALYDALSQTPGVKYLGNKKYEITPSILTQNSALLPEDAPRVEPLDPTTALVNELIKELRPDVRFPVGLLFALIKGKNEALTAKEVDRVITQAVSSGRITAHEDGRFSLREEHITPTPREDLGSQPVIPSEIVVTRGTLDGMMRVLGRPGRKPYRKKHSGWKRPANMNGAEE